MMIVYLSSYANVDKLEFLEQTESLIKVEYTELTTVHLINIIKMELRNIDIETLVIDIDALFIENVDDIKDVLEGFYILNPSSTAIILLQDDVNHKELNKFDYQNFFLVCYKNISFETDILNIILNIKEIEEDSCSLEVPEHVSIDEIVVGSTDEISEAYEERMKNNQNNNDEDILKSENEKVSPVVELDSLFLKAKRKKIVDNIPLKKVKKGIENSWLMEEEINIITVINDGEVIKDIEPIKEVIEVEDIYMSEWSCKNVMIGIVGSSNNVGTTTAALQIAFLLDSMGANVSLTSIKDESALYQECDFKKENEESIFKYNNITFYSNSQFDLNKDDNFIIFDLSYFKDYEKTYKILKEMCSTVFVVASNRTSELDELMMTLEFLDNIESNIIINLASSVNSNIIDNLKQYDIHCINNLSYIDYNNRLNWSCNDDLTNMFLNFKTLL